MTNNNEYGISGTSKGCATRIGFLLTIMFIICVIGGILSYTYGTVPKIKPITNTQSNK